VTTDEFKPYKFFQSIRDNRGLTTSAKLVAFVLGTHASEKSNLVWPAVKTIAAEAGLSVDTVKHALIGLEKAGVQKPIGYHGKTMSRALFPARHDASCGNRKRNMGGTTTHHMGGTTTHKVITKINDQVASSISCWDASSISWDWGATTTPEPPQAAAGKGSIADGAGLQDIGAPQVGRHGDSTLITSGNDSCPECGSLAGLQPCAMDCPTRR
jgi:hypothetical protein